MVQNLFCARASCQQHKAIRRLLYQGFFWKHQTQCKNQSLAWRPALTASVRCPEVTDAQQSSLFLHWFMPVVETLVLVWRAHRPEGHIFYIPGVVFWMGGGPFSVNRYFRRDCCAKLCWLPVESLSYKNSQQTRCVVAVWSSKTILYDFYVKTCLISSYLLISVQGGALPAKLGP